MVVLKKGKGEGLDRLFCTFLGGLWIFWTGWRCLGEVNSWMRSPSCEISMQPREICVWERVGSVCVKMAWMETVEQY